MKKLQILGKNLSKNEQRKITGGYIAPDGGGCYIVYSTNNQSSCWYITGSPQDLCHRVYGGNCSAHSDGSVDCQTNNCTMN
jgi:hypothetical protein